MATSLAAATPPFAGDWKGRIVLPAGGLEIGVHIAGADGQWSGRIDIPAQGAKGLALTNFSIAGDSISFAIAGVPGNPTFHGVYADGDDGETIAGPFTQGSMTVSFSLTRGAIDEAARPQDPKPPFPYSSEEVSFSHDHVRLAGTLTIPPGDGPFPAVVLLTGSGPQDRNEEIFGHRPFLVIADFLSRRGIAVLRYDDRGVGGSTGAGAGDTSADFAEDALAAVAFLQQRADIHKNHIGLVGHSEGALIATIAAAKSDDVAFIVLLAGPGVPGSQLLPVQVEALGRANGLPDSVAAEQGRIFRDIIAVAISDRDSTEIKEEMAPLFRRHIALEPDAEKLSKETIDESVTLSTQQFISPWFRFFFTYDPRPALRRIDVPVLALNGSLDRQVVPAQNLMAIEDALTSGGNPDVTARELPGLNHLFQHASTGALSEFSEIDETIAPEVLELIAAWIESRGS